MNLYAVITGDIVNSSEFETTIWIKKLKEIFSESDLDKNWEIFRGDSFQLICEAEKAIEILFSIKSGIKSIKGLDVRMSLGLGEIDYKGTQISESNGSAFVNSGRSFELLKKETLGIKSNDGDFNEIFEVMIKMADFISKGWQPGTSEIIYTALQNPEYNQSQLAEKLNKKSQGNISEALKRGGFEEIMSFNHFYKLKVKEL